MQTIRVSEPRELLSLVPYQLGFVPHESAVLVSVRRRRAQVGLVARVDLDELGDPVRGPQVARTLTAHLLRDGAQRAVLVVYTGDREGSAALLDAARRHVGTAAEHHLGEVECWLVGPDGYRHAECPSSPCCPASGRPAWDLRSTTVSAEMVLRGVGVAASREQLGEVRVVDAAARRSARRAAARWSARRLGADGPAELHRWRRAGLELWRSQLEEASGRSGDVPGGGGVLEPTATVVGRLQAALDDVLVRDAVLVGLLPGNDRLADVLLVESGGADVAQALRRLVDPVHGVAPDPVRVAPARALLERLVAHGGRDGHAPALTLLGVVAWWEGDGARAAVLLERALRAVPGYRLASLVQEALSHGMPPGWLARRSA